MIADDEMMRGKTTCPFLRTALKADLLDFDGATASLDAVQSLLGGGVNGFGTVARFFATENHRPHGTPAGRFDALNLVGSKGDHPGDSQILGRAGFAAGRFDFFTRHAIVAADGRRYMTAKELGAAIAEDLHADPASRLGLDPSANDMRNSAGEFGLLLEGFGKSLTEADGTVKRVLFVDDMRLLFESNQFPADWRQTIAQASLIGWTTTAFGLSTRGGIYGEALAAYHALRGGERP